MSALDVIRDAQTRDLVDEDGQPVEIELAPGLTDSEIDVLSRELPCDVPSETRELLKYCRGFSGTAVELVDFSRVAISRSRAAHSCPLQSLDPSRTTPGRAGGSP